MATFARLATRLLRYLALLTGWTAAGVGLVWVLVWIFPFLFERTKGLWELIMGEEMAHDAVVGLASLMLAYLLGSVADVTWRGIYLAPITGDRAAQDLPPSRMERLVIWLGRIVAAGVIFLLPGAFGVLETTGRWLPEVGSPGAVGLTVILALAVGVTIFVGDLWVFSWRARPGHDLGASTPDLPQPNAALRG